MAKWEILQEGERFFFQPGEMVAHGAVGFAEGFRFGSEEEEEVVEALPVAEGNRFGAEGAAGPHVVEMVQRDAERPGGQAGAVEDGAFTGAATHKQALGEGAGTGRPQIVEGGVEPVGDARVEDAEAIADADDGTGIDPGKAAGLAGFEGERDDGRKGLADFQGGEGASETDFLRAGEERLDASPGAGKGEAAKEREDGGDLREIVAGGADEKAFSAAGGREIPDGEGGFRRNGAVERDALDFGGEGGAGDDGLTEGVGVEFAMEDDALTEEKGFIHAAGEVESGRRTDGLDNEGGVVHVGDDAVGLAAGGIMFVAGVKIAEFIDARGEVGEIGEMPEEAGADVLLVAGSGGTGGERHAGLVEFFVEDVHGAREIPEVIGIDRGGGFDKSGCSDFFRCTVGSTLGWSAVAKIMSRSAPASHPPLTRGLLGLLAVASGLTVANIYYNQSLLVDMGQDFHASASTMGGIAVATQLGYASGLLLLVPLGDILDRKGLIVGSAGAATLVLVGVAVAPGFGFALIASYLLGLICITPQFILPYTAHLAEPEKRGRAVGLVMGGLLIGVLFSRSAAGFLGQWLGWREVFGIGAGLTLLVTLALGTLPRSPAPSRHLSYRELLGSLGPLLAREPVLQRHGLIGALSFAAFSAFWTTLVFYLAARPEHFGGNAVGLFGLVAIAGAAAAPVSGRLSERWSAQVVNGTSLGILTVSFLLMLPADRSLGWLIAGVFLMDAGAQSNQISNQTRIYALAPELRNRITSVYMVIYFLGGAVGAALGAGAWVEGHWTGVCLLGAGLGLLGLGVLFAFPEKGLWPKRS
jgi:predicted MFS family arabinose efflux permease